MDPTEEIKREKPVEFEEYEEQIIPTEQPKEEPFLNTVEDTRKELFMDLCEEFVSEVRKFSKEKMVEIGNNLYSLSQGESIYTFIDHLEKTYKPL